MITASVLKEHLIYDSETGLFWWKFPRRKRQLNKPCGNRGNNGYVRISIDHKFYQAHRLAVLWQTGKMPIGDIDHINGVRHDNRIVNLRVVNRMVNLQNLKCAKRHNKIGMLGVQRNHNRFMARIKIGKHSIYLGTFNTPEQAHIVYLEAKRLCHEGNTL